MTLRVRLREVKKLCLEKRHETIRSVIDFGAGGGKLRVRFVRLEYELRPEGSSFHARGSHGRSRKGFVEEAVHYYPPAGRAASVRGCRRLSKGHRVCGFDQRGPRNTCEVRPANGAAGCAGGCGATGGGTVETSGGRGPARGGRR